jgi:RNA polymerase sigma factor (sigma-70 family)
MIPSDGFNAWLRRAQAGDRQAQEALLAALRPHLEKLARTYADPAGAGQSVADLAQEACLRVWQKLDQFQGTDDDGQTRARFRAWVDRIVCRLGQNSRRDQRARRRTPAQGLARLGEPGGAGGGGEPPGREPTPSVNVRRVEQLESVRAALLRLPSEAGRVIVQLHVFEGVSLREVARRLGLSYDQVRERYRASMEFLEGELGPLS